VKKVRDLMQTQVFSVHPDDTIDRVFFLFHYEKIRHVPVVDRTEIVGIVSDRDLYKALGPRSRRQGVVTLEGDTSLYVIPKKVKHIMRRGVITVAPDADLADAAALMARRRIGALPVVERKKLAGIITATDLLQSYAKLAAELEKLAKG